VDIIARLDEQRSAIDVLEHPFYRRWNEGKVSRAELAFYAGQYQHLVCALAEASAQAADGAPSAHARGLAEHAAEEDAHIAMWERFAAASGAVPAPPTTQTESCTRAWRSGRDLLERLSILYAIEASQPTISAVKLAGLEAHYGYAPDAPATDYFREHSTTDVAHAEQAAALIRELAGDADDEVAERMVRAAGGALRGNWDMLDGIEEPG
jgi:pyrroloquinoline-quinone synthase